MSSPSLQLLQRNGKKCRRQGNWGQNRLIMVNRQGVGKEGLGAHFWVSTNAHCQSRSYGNDDGDE